MKSVTEFPSFKLADGLKAKAALAAEGKTPEEITAALGEQFKLEGDKLKCFANAVEVAGNTTEKLFRIKVVKLNEGQNPPARATIIEDLCYIAELQTNPADIKKAADAAAEAAAAKANAKDARGGKGGDRKQGGKGGGKPKSSPWGASPEEKEAKLNAAREAARAKSLAGKS